MVNGSRRKKVKNEKIRIRISRALFLLSRITLFSCNIKNPADMHKRTKTEKEAPGFFFQNRISNPVPINNEMIKAFLFIHVS